MAQLQLINQDQSPARLTFGVRQDLALPEVSHVIVRVHSQGGILLSGRRFRLQGLEGDYLVSLAEAAVTAFQFGEGSHAVGKAVDHVRETARKRRLEREAAAIFRAALEPF